MTRGFLVEKAGQVKPSSLLFFFISFVTEIGYLLAFYPGVLSFDSVNQWAQLSEFNFSNWHPAYHTILMWVITRIWYSPAAVALFQILAYSLVIAYGLSMFKEEFGMPCSVLIVIDICISLIPINGLMIITLWKDVLYSIATLLLMIFLLKIIHSRGEWIASGHNWVWLALVVANVALLRFNGAPVAFVTLLACIIFPHYWRYILKVFVVSLIYIIVIIGPIYKVFRVDTSKSQSIGVIFVHPIAAQVDAGTKLTDSEIEYLNKIFPIKGEWPYSCYDATVLFYKGVDFQPVQQHPFQAAKIFWDLTLKNPKVTLDHFICLSSFVWQIRQPKDVYLETVLTSNIDVSSYANWNIFEGIVAQRSKIPVLRDLIIKVIQDSFRFDRGSILWRPAIYMYIFYIAVIIAVFRSGNKLLFLLLTPIVVQTFVIALTAQLQALRYQYPVYLASMLFSVPLIYVAIRKPLVLE